MSTHYPGHGTKLVEETDLEAFDGVIAAGGDGTIFEVLNGLYQHPKAQRPPMGLLPIGTGNAFARDLNLQPSDWRTAIGLLQQGRTHPFDVGWVQAADCDYYFLNVVGMGFAVDAGLTARHIKFVGNGAYTLATLWQTLRLKPYPLVVDVDGLEISQNNVLLEISNTRYTGTHFLIAPGALIDDGKLDVTLLENLPRPRLLRIFPAIYKGRHVDYSEVCVYQAKQITIRKPAGMLLGPDGEFRGRTPATITCLKQDLSIFA